MQILAATKTDVIQRLAAYAATLNGGRVKKKVYDSVARVYKMLSDQTQETARYIECSEAEIEILLREYVQPIFDENNIVVTVYLSRQTSVYAKQKVENAVRDAVAAYVFPSTLDDDRIIICLSYLSAAAGELYDIDYAANLLRYGDDFYWDT